MEEAKKISNNANTTTVDTRIELMIPSGQFCGGSWEESFRLSEETGSQQKKSILLACITGYTLNGFSDNDEYL
jgi:hypothetical protein